MPPAPPLASDLEQELQRLFPRDDIPAASALLLSYGEHSYEREVNRVRWGILTVAAKTSQNWSVWSS
jgi:hypothetical protein